MRRFANNIDGPKPWKTLGTNKEYYLISDDDLSNIKIEYLDKKRVENLYLDMIDVLSRVKSGEWIEITNIHDGLIFDYEEIENKEGD